MEERVAMPMRGCRTALAVLVVAGLVAGLGILPAGAATGWADPAFEHVWQQADGPVASGQAQRSWLWGPAPVGSAREYYVESSAPGARRLVQYFDKARMEITNPGGDPNSIWYVTTGLLVKELVSGQRQYGDNSYGSAGAGARIAVAGDPAAGTPVYGDFAGVATLDGQAHRADDRGGQTVREWIAAGGAVTIADGPAAVQLADYESATGHNIASVFWTWLNDPANGLSVYGSWVYPMGYPITEPFWLNTSFGGTTRPVLVQLFERRVLTFNPGNAPEWQVEMGNVGRHYLEWARPAADQRAAWTLDGAHIAVQSQRGGSVGVYLADPAGGALTTLFDTPYDDSLGQALPGGAVAVQSFDGTAAAFAWWSVPLSGGTPRMLDIAGSSPVWSPDGSKVASLLHEDAGPWSIVVQAGSGGTPVTVGLGTGPYLPGIAWSPDGARLAWCDCSVGDFAAPSSSVWVANADGSDLHSVGGIWAFTRIVQVAWSPDGAQLVAARQLVDGSSELHVLMADGSGDQALVMRDGDGAESAAAPAWSSTGAIAFVGMDATGAQGIWTIGPDGGSLHQLTDGAADAMPSWSPSGDRLLYLGGPHGDEVWLINADGSDKHLVDTPPGV